MDFGSEFVYSYSDSEEEEISAEAIETPVDSVPEGATQTGGARQRPMSVTAAMGVGLPPLGAPPPAIAQTVFVEECAPEDATQTLSAPARRSKQRSKSVRAAMGVGLPPLDAPPPPLPRRPSSRSEGVSAEGSGSSRAGQKWRCADTNVVVVKFDRLTEPSNMHTGDPIVCSGCQVMLSHISKITQDGKKKIWTCEFCETKNKVEIVPEEIPSKADVTYMLEPALVAAASDGDASGKTECQESIVVFCIDYSGSMSTIVAGSGNSRITRLAGVKKAVCHQLERLADTSPGCRVAVVAFESSVKVIADGKDICEHRIPDDIFDEKMKLLEVASDLNLPSRICDSRKTLTQNVLREPTGGSTALGPGLLVSVGIARQMARSKVIVCTDGQANAGLGSLANSTAAYAFYTEVADIAKESGVSVSVLTIAGTDCKLVELGRVAELTGGQVNIVDPQTATEEFGNILADAIIATHATARFSVHRNLYVRGEAERPSHALRDIGNVTRGAEISFEYGVRPKKKPKTNDGCKGAKKDDDGDDKRDEPDNDSVAVAAQTTTTETDDIGQKHCKVSIESTTAPVVQEPANMPMVQEPGNPPVTQEPNTVPKDEPLIPEVAVRLPFQVQIRYTDSKGAKTVRVFTETKPITKDRKEAESRMNIPILGTHAIRDAADKALNAQYMESRLTDCSYTKMFHRNAIESEHLTEEFHLYGKASRSVQSSVVSAQRAEARSKNSSVMDTEKMLQKMGSDEVRRQRRQTFDDRFAEGCYKGMKLSSDRFAKTTDKVKRRPVPELPLLSPSLCLERTSSAVQPTPTVTSPPVELYDQSKADDEPSAPLS